MIFEIIQTDSGVELEYMTRGLDSDDFIFQRNSWEYEMRENGDMFYKLWYNSIGTILSGKKDASYFSISDGSNTEVGYVDDMGDREDRFGVKIKNKIFICERSGNKFVIINDNKIIACVKRKLINDMDNYLIYCKENEHINIIMLITLYIDLEWFSEGRMEVLNSISDKGILEELGGYKLPLFAKHKAWSEFDAKSKIYNKR